MNSDLFCELQTPQFSLKNKKKENKKNLKSG